MPVPYHRQVFGNGLVVLVVENPVADIVSTRMFLRAGSLREAGGQAGLSHLAMAVLTKGTQQRSAREIAECVESAGASLSANAAPDYLVLNLKTVSADFTTLLRLAAELLRSPTFPEAEVELERRLTLQAIRAQQEQPMTVAIDQLRQAMYQGHPYAQSLLGTAATVDPASASRSTALSPDLLPARQSGDQHCGACHGRASDRFSGSAIE